MISDKRLSDALTYLSTTDEIAAELKVQVARKKYLCKMARSRVYLTSEGPVEARKALAEASEEVKAAEDEYHAAILEFEKVRVKRTTEALVVEVWRSLTRTVGRARYEMHQRGQHGT